MRRSEASPRHQYESQAGPAAASGGYSTIQYSTVQCSGCIKAVLVVGSEG